MCAPLPGAPRRSWWKSVHIASFGRQVGGGSFAPQGTDTNCVPIRTQASAARARPEPVAELLALSVGQLVRRAGRLGVEVEGRLGVALPGVLVLDLGVGAGQVEV